MGSIERHEQIPEVMRRTMKNLRFIKENCGMEGPFEVTQLVNSFLGALAHPWEEVLKEHRRTPENFPRLNDLLAHFTGQRFYGEAHENPIEILGYVRNAFAHGNVEFLKADRWNGSASDIGGVRLWNCTIGPKCKNWEIELNVAQLEALLEDFEKVATELLKDHWYRRPYDCKNDVCN